MDLRANIDKPVTIKPLERLIIPTGIRIDLNKGYEAQIRPRSGLAAKHGITVLNTPGTIDENYINEIKVILVNLSNEEFVITPEMRVAQMVINKFEKVELKVVNDFSEVKKENSRGGGLGHTGTQSKVTRKKRSGKSKIKEIKKTNSIDG